jgi:subtilisin family serine protease
LVVAVSVVLVGVGLFPAAAVGVVRGGVSFPADTSVDGQWWLASWGIDEVWKTGARGQGVTVAVSDTGVQASRSELAGVVLPGTDFEGGDGRIDLDTASGGHGTGMAVLIAGQGGDTGLVGVAPEAKILPLVHGQGEAIHGGVDIRWAVDHGAKVVNMSYVAGPRCNADEAEGVAYAGRHGVSGGAGAGNYGLESNSPSAPANCPGVLAVGAMDAQAQPWDDSTAGDYVDVVAPGDHMLWVTNEGKTSYPSGTSGATALTSGAVALVWSAFPELSSREVTARVLAGLWDMQEPGHDDKTGWGAVRPLNSITQDVPAGFSHPVLDELDALGVDSQVGVTGEPSATDSAAASPEDGSGDASGVSPLVWVGLAGGAGLIVVVVIVAVVLAGRSRRSQQPAMSGAVPPGAYPPGPPSGPPPGYQQGPPPGYQQGSPGPRP